MVRQRSKTGQGKNKRCLSRKDSSGSLVENTTVKDEGKDKVPGLTCGIRVAMLAVFTTSIGLILGVGGINKKSMGGYLFWV